MASSIDTAPPHVRATHARHAATMARDQAELLAMRALADRRGGLYFVEEVLAELDANIVDKPDPPVPPPHRFFRLKQYQQDIDGIDRGRAAILGAALRLLAVDPREAFGVFDTWVEKVGGPEEWRLDLHGWGTLGYLLDEREIVLRFVDWT
jgi:hypothetical protein